MEVLFDRTKQACRIGPALHDSTSEIARDRKNDKHVDTCFEEKRKGGGRAGGGVIGRDK